MIKGVLRRETLAAVAVLLCTCQVRAQQRGEVVGIVQELQGTVLMRAAGAKEQTTLNVGRDRGRAVYPGESFRCQKGAMLRLHLGGQSKVINGPSPWFKVASDADEADRYRQAYKEYVRIGGRPRGDRPPVFSPANNGAVMPASFVIRWNPRPRARRVTLTIRDSQDEEVWRQEAVDNRANSLVSEAARRALARHRDLGGDETLKLIWQDDSGGDGYTTVFSLLSTKDEETVGAELAGWEAESDPLMRHLGRAFVYRVNWMFPQAADEYEAALKVAPASRDLLQRTILAQRDTGNHVRVDELQSRLTPRTGLR